MKTAVTVRNSKFPGASRECQYLPRMVKKYPDDEIDVDDNEGGS